MPEHSNEPNDAGVAGGSRQMKMFVPGDSFNRSGSEQVWLRGGPSHAAAARADQSPPVFVHLRSAIDSRMLDIAASSEMTTSVAVEEGLEQNRSYVLGVSSAIRGEGKTTTAIFLAIRMARDSHKKICLMDFSLCQNDDDLGHRLRLYDNIVSVPDPLARGLETSGVVDVLEEASHSVNAFQMMEPDNLTIIPAGRASMRSPRNARSLRVPQILLSVRQVYDIVIVDLPAVATECAIAMMRYIDGVMLVVQSGTTSRQLVQQSIEMIGQERIVGVALNRIQTSIPDWLLRRLPQ